MAQVIWTALAALAMIAAPAQAARKQPPAPAAPAPPAPSVRQAVELWRSGDYAGAVAMWQPFANAGDADAMFNIGQAHKLGRAAPKDMGMARDWYRRAAQKGHLPAQANLGILLFQAGEKPEAIRWLKAAADKNEMRAQYVLGVASWNGDGMPRNLALAYGYLSRAATQGLPEATSAVGNLTGQLSPVERANGIAVASSLAGGNGVPPEFAGGTALASADRYDRDQVIKRPPSTAATARAQNEAGVYRPGPAAGPIVIAQGPPAPKPSEIAAGTITPMPRPATAAGDRAAERPGTPVVTSVGIPPSPAAPPPARDALPVATASAAPARPAPTPAPEAGPIQVRKPEAVAAVAKPAPPVARPTETAAAGQRPAETAVQTARPAVAAAVQPDPGAARPVATAAAAPPRKPDAGPPVAVKPVQTASLTPPRGKATKTDATVPKPALPSGWKVQLGAFSKKAQAEAAWSEVQVKQKALVAKSKPIYFADGSVTKLQIGPFPTKAAARDTCAKIAFSGRACFVTEG